MSMMPNFRNSPRNPHIHDPFKTNIWDPFSELFHEHNILPPVPPPPPLLPPPHHHFPMIGAPTASRFEWRETPEAHLVTAELPPGFKKEEVKVRVEDGGRVLEISGNRAVEREEKHDNWHHIERSKGRFLRAFTLPENCRADQIRSTMENGVLTVTVPKRDVVKKHNHADHNHDDVKNIEVKG